MTQKRALCTGRIDKARGINTLSGRYETVQNETDSEFNGSMLHNLSRELIACDGDEMGPTFDRDGGRL